MTDKARAGVVGALRSGAGERAGAGWPLQLHRRRVLARLGRSQCHQYPARIIDHSRILRRLLRLSVPPYQSVPVRAGGGAAPVLPRLRNTARVHQSGHGQPGPHHADAALRPEPVALQFDDSRFQSGFPQGHSVAAARIHQSGRRHRPDRSRDQHGLCPCPGRAVVRPAARFADRARDRRRAHGPGSSTADGRKCQAHLRHHLRPRRGHGRRRRQPVQRHVPDLAGNRECSPGQGICDLRPGRIG